MSITDLVNFNIYVFNIPPFTCVLPGKSLLQISDRTGLALSKAVPSPSTSSWQFAKLVLNNG